MKARSSLLTVGADSYPAGLFACSTLSHCGQRVLIAKHVDDSAERRYTEECQQT
jgi:hypothetical protein